MKEYWPFIVIMVIAFVAFVILLRKGAFLRLSNYWNETKEELFKCTWPTWEELRGSTAVVIVAIAVLGGFTVGVDYVVTIIIQHIV